MFSLLDLFFPSKCLGCQIEGSSICHACFQKIQLKKIQQCPICRLKINHGEVCEKCKKKTPLKGVLVTTTYEKNPLIRKVINQFKYKFNEDLKEKLGKLITGHYQKNIHLQKTNKQQILLIPVPLHFLRQWQRGFNQAELLAQVVSKKTRIPVTNLLKRIRNTPQQAKLNRQARLANLKNAFQINQKTLKKLEYQPKDYTIILIDDVASTLSTLQESARTLKKQGFKNIWGLVIARG